MRIIPSRAHLVEVPRLFVALPGELIIRGQHGFLMGRIHRPIRPVGLPGLRVGHRQARRAQMVTGQEHHDRCAVGHGIDRHPPRAEIVVGLGNRAAPRHCHLVPGAHVVGLS
jgi:hypothetical protein